MPKQPKQADRVLDPERWVDEHGDYLYRFAISRLRDPETAQDLVQDTLVGALDAQDRYQGRASERTWLMSILKHKIIDHYRIQYRERPITEFELEDQTAEDLFDRLEHWKEGMSSWRADPAELLEAAEFWDVLDECVAEVPPRLREAFILRVMDEQSTDEVCKILNVTATNLNVMLHRARLRLRKCLEDNWFAE